MHIIRRGFRVLVHEAHKYLRYISIPLEPGLECWRVSLFARPAESTALATDLGWPSIVANPVLTSKRRRSRQPGCPPPAGICVLRTWRRRLRADLRRRDAYGCVALGGEWAATSAYLSAGPHGPHGVHRGRRVWKDRRIRRLDLAECYRYLAISRLVNMRPTMGLS